MFGIEVDQYRPPFGDLVTTVLIVIAVAALVWLYVLRQRDVSRLRRVAMAIFRAAAIAVVAWVLFGPSSQWGEEFIRGRLPVLMFADVSASMSQADVANPQPRDGEVAIEPITRWQALTRTWLDPEYHRQLEQAADIKLFAFDETVRRMGLDEAQAHEPDGKATLMYDSLRQGIESVVQQASRKANSERVGLAVLLTDGHDTKRSGDAGLGLQLKQAGWTVLSVPVGSTRNVRDIALNAWTDADFLFEEQATWINADVTQTGFEHRQVEITLLREGQRVDSKIVTFETDPTAQIRFRVKPPQPESRSQRIEGYRVVARIVPLPGSVVDEDNPEETLLDNNSRWVFLQISTDRIRVALFEAQPYWDTKFLARVMRDDPQIELTSVYNLASGRTVTVQSNVRAGAMGENVTEKDFDPMWLTQKKLDEFDVIVLGKGAEKFFGGYRAQWLVDYVEKRGGSLVLARGRPFDTATGPGRAADAILARIEPVEWGTDAYDHLKLKLTQAGRTSPLLGLSSLTKQDALLTELPDMIAATRVKREKAMSIVLLRQSAAAGEKSGPDMAAVAYRNAGQGRVLAVLTDGLWQWAFLPSDLEQYDTIYQGFWARTLRWLATGGQFLPGQGMSLGLSRLKAEPGESVDVAVTTRYVEDASFTPKLTVTAPNGSKQDVQLTRTTTSSARYLGSFRPEQPGVHEVLLTADGVTADPGGGATPGPDGQPAPITIRGRLAVYEESDEKRDPTARPELLKQLSETTGGRCLALNDRDAVPQMLDQIWQARQKDKKMSYIFNKPLIFTLIAAFFGLEWIIRRRGGLL